MESVPISGSVTLAAILAFAGFFICLPFIFLQKVNPSLPLKVAGISLAGILAFSLVAALLSECSFAESVLATKVGVYSCGFFGLSRLIFFCHVGFFLGAALLPVAWLRSVLNQRRGPNKSFKGTPNGAP